MTIGAYNIKLSKDVTVAVVYLFTKLPSVLYFINGKLKWIFEKTYKP